MRERALGLALRLAAEVITNTIVVVARAADWALSQVGSETDRFLTMGGSEWLEPGVSSDWLFDDEPSVRNCPCGKQLNRDVAGDFDEHTDWRHDDDNTRACDAVARELFEIRWDWRDSIGLYGPAINTKAVELLKVDPDEYFRLHQIWRALPKD